VKSHSDSVFVWGRRIWGWSDPDRPRSAVVLVVSNFIPLVGAVFLGWNIGAIVVLYWFECVIVGILNVPKMALAHGRVTTSGSWVIGAILYKVVAIPFFIFHYGVFLLVAGAAAIYLAFTAGGSLPPTTFAPREDFRQAFALLDLPVAGLFVAALALLISHLVSFNDFLIRRDYEGIDSISQMGAPYPRVFVLLAAAFASGIVIAAMGGPVWAVATFVIGKTLLDLRLSEAERKRHAA